MFQSIDIFGLPYRMTFNKSPYFKSTIGGIFTIFLFSIAVLCMLFFGKEIILRKQPQIIVDTQKFSEGLNLTLSMQMAFVFQLKTGEVIKDFERYIDIELRYYNSTTELSTGQSFSSSKIELSKCNIENFDSYLKDDFNLRSLQNGFCLKEGNLPMRGFYSLSTVKYYELLLSECKNSSLKSQPCYSSEFIRKELNKNDKQILVYYISKNFNPINYDSPLISYLSYESFSISPSICKRSDFFIGTITVETDSGYINSKKNLESHQIIDYISSDFYIKTLNDSCYLKLQLHSGETNRHYLRLYMKIPELLAQMGGIINTFNLIFSFFLHSIYSRRMKEYIIKKLFHIDNKEIHQEVEKIIKSTNKLCGQSKDENKDKRLGKSLENVSFQDSNQEHKTSTIVSNSNENEKQKEECKITNANNFTIDKSFKNLHDLGNLEQSNNQMKEIAKSTRSKQFFNTFNNRFKSQKWVFSLFQNFILIFSPCLASKKLKSLDIYFKKLNEYAIGYTDVLNIAEHLNDIEKIKIVLFSKRQLALFNSIANIENPLNLEGKNKLTSYYKFAKDMSSNRSIIEKYLKDYEENPDFGTDNKIDKKLIDLIRK
jgi:hypothetical protein